MTSIVKLSHLETADGVRQIPVSNIAEMNGSFTLRNKILDGRFDFWYEGTSQTANGYNTMWFNDVVGSTHTVTRENLIPGVDLPAIECPSAKYFSRTVVNSVTGSDNRCRKYQCIEDVRTLAGKTATLSFYARADSTKYLEFSLEQQFGGGSASLIGLCSTKFTLTSVWERHTATVNIPSLAGKTIGTDGTDRLVPTFWFDMGSTYNSQIGQQSGTFDLACIQLEEGSVATPFEELPIALSKTLLNRFIQEVNIGGDWCIAYMNGTVVTTNPVSMPEMRTIPNQSAINASQFRYRSIAGANKATPTIVTIIMGLRGYQLRLEIPSTTYAAGDFVSDSTGQSILLSARL